MGQSGFGRVGGPGSVTGVELAGAAPGDDAVEGEDSTAMGIVPAIEGGIDSGDIGTGDESSTRGAETAGGSCTFEHSLGPFPLHTTGFGVPSIGNDALDEAQGGRKLIFRPPLRENKTQPR